MRLRCNIYKHQNSDCSNGGISHDHDNVILAWDEDESKLPDAINGTPVVKLVKREMGQRVYLHAEPVAKPPKNHNGWMMGGCYIKSSDGRFPHDYPISLHDRAEGPQMSKFMD